PTPGGGPSPMAGRSASRTKRPTPSTPTAKPQRGKRALKGKWRLVEADSSAHSPARHFIRTMSVERTLHHFPLDPASRQVRLALGEKRLPFVEVSERYWERPAGFVALNPSGLTP